MGLKCPIGAGEAMAEDSKTDILKYTQQGDAAALAAALDKGADPDSADRWGVTALAHAAQKGDLEIVQMLLQKGASPDRPLAQSRATRARTRTRGRIGGPIRKAQWRRARATASSDRACSSAIVSRLK